ncbi:3' terminal RNA ribose 2'-O-methyltransferase Hen1 [Streptacidiphilus pinicola]|uniref:Small RNA 2'-O-methyltransferase n=1 Tax=Streptacidiphilus pinicola TaxID=2219663 RepID=A0A2X0KLV3_9ACTN|nr:3' terminal RNA ribose 2'-O-methyltransferase Hen1 [Streptacidiphilus pinicola]RAG87630.1 3' terminal RNA ribose 2'-O-methyltransferase Hen1 [Streptacidiphilus pinicola]
MFLTISTIGTDQRPATDLGFLLHKHPEKAQSFSTAHGLAHVFYPEAGAERCTAALLLEVDPIALVRRGRGTKGRGSGSPDFALSQYVNDRPYAASSLLAVALSAVFKSAMKGDCKARPELAAEPQPLTIELPAVPAKGGADLVRRLFEPLGWQVDAEPLPLDPTFPEWGDSRYVGLRLTGTLRLADALSQLYVLLPVLDDAKHYWVAPDEVDKLLTRGGGWLAAHPERQLIIRRYFSRRWSLARAANERLELARLAEADDREPEELDNAVPEETASPEGESADPAAAEPVEPKPTPLAVHRRAAIIERLRAAGATRVLDLGCGEAALVAELLKDRAFTEIVGVEVSARALAIAARRLRLDRMNERQAARVKLLQGALTYTDARLTGYDAAVLSEVIEHVDEERLPALEYAVFGAARPGTVVVTTPNVEYNVRWESLPAGHVRHGDHRFEWDRAQFRAWAEQTAETYGYAVEFGPVGEEDPEVGPPTQLAAFTRTDTTTTPKGA